jgi:hypothetical protein
LRYVQQALQIKVDDMTCKRWRKECIAKRTLLPLPRWQTLLLLLLLLSLWIPNMRLAPTAFGHKQCIVGWQLQYHLTCFIAGGCYKAIAPGLLQQLC